VGQLHPGWSTAALRMKQRLLRTSLFMQSYGVRVVGSLTNKCKAMHIEECTVQVAAFLPG
jgi:hypothetical protein